MRRRLTIVAAAVTTMVALSFLIPLALLVRELASDRVLTAAERDAQTVAQVLTAVSPTQDLATAFALIAPSGTINGRALSVILPDETTLGAPLSAGEDISGARGGAASRQEVPTGVAVYVPVVLPTGQVAVVRVLAEAADLTRNVGRAWLTLGLLGAFLITAAVAVADRLARSLLASVEELSQTAERLGAGDLDARVEPSGPREIAEMGRTFNQLAFEVEQLLQRERETAADLSHRLRTPLTAARLDAEALPDDEDRSRLLDDLAELERTVDHIIREARRPVRRQEAVAVDLTAVVRDRTDYWGALAEDQSRAWRADLPRRRLMVSAPPGDLEAAIDALIGNVFAHTREGTAFSVRVGSAGRTATIQIDDAGAGFPSSASLERGTSGADSTGLGLDIARRTAEAVGGRLVIGRSQAGGARVVMTLPLHE